MYGNLFEMSAELPSNLILLVIQCKPSLEKRYTVALQVVLHSLRVEKWIRIATLLSEQVRQEWQTTS
jgi:hypothetical protein